MTRQALFTVSTGQDGSYLTEFILELAGFDGEIEWNTSMPDGQPSRCLDTSKAKEEFGFKAKTDFREGLKRTIEWYEKAR